MMSLRCVLALVSLVLCAERARAAQDLYAGGADGALLRGHPVVGDFRVVAVCEGPIQSMCFDGRDVLVGDSSGRIYRYEPASDTLTQPFSVGNDARALTLYRGAAGEELFAGGGDGTVLRVDKDTGAHLGTIPVGVPVETLLVEGGVVSVGSSTGILATYDLEHGGAVTWCSVPARIDVLRADASHLIAADRSGWIHRIARDTHQIAASFPTPNDATALVLHTQQLLTAGSDGTIHRIDRHHGGLAQTLELGRDIAALALSAQVAPGAPHCFGRGCPCGNDDPAAGCENSTGAGSSLLASGTTSVLADDLFLAATRIPPGRSAFFCAGAPAAAVPFGDGLLCIDTTTPLRFPVSSAGPSGSARLGPGIVRQTRGRILPGQTYAFQVWYRDSSGPCGSALNLSNAYTLTFTP